jgi:hypothetical protein
MEMEEWCKAVQRGLHGDTTLTPLDWRRVEETGSLQALQENASVQAMLGLLASAGLPASVGLNMGSVEVSFVATVPATPAFGTFDAAGGTSSNAANATNALLLCMLGVLPQQAELEAWYKTVTGTTEPLANNCLAAFEKQTHLSLLAREYNLRGRALRLTWDPRTRGLKRY